MRAGMLKLTNLIDQLNEQAGRFISWLNPVLVILVCYDVISRALKMSQPWVMEMEWHLFAAIFLIGAGYTLKHDGHVRVDLFFSNFSKKDQAWVNLLGTLLFLLPWAALVSIFAFEYAQVSFLINEGSSDPGGLPARYVIKFVVVIGFVFLFLQGIAQFLKALLVLINKKPNAADS